MTPVIPGVSFSGAPSLPSVAPKGSKPRKAANPHLYELTRYELDAETCPDHFRFRPLSAKEEDSCRLDLGPVLEVIPQIDGPHGAEVLVDLARYLGPLRHRAAKAVADSVTERVSDWRQECRKLFEGWALVQACRCTAMQGKVRMLVLGQKAREVTPEQAYEDTSLIGDHVALSLPHPAPSREGEFLTCLSSPLSVSDWVSTREDAPPPKGLKKLLEYSFGRLFRISTAGDLGDDIGYKRPSRGRRSNAVRPYLDGRYPVNLAGALWLELGNYLTGLTKVKACQTCARLFASTGVENRGRTGGPSQCRICKGKL